MSAIRVRFAPSPTGFLHVGGVRTALFCWLFARHNGGRFILRVEDTDRERSTPEAVQVILDGLSWLGLTWDEGPFYQSERTQLYLDGVEKLLEQDRAYRCYCTAEELETRRAEALAAGHPPKYDGRCRHRADQPDQPYTVRFAAPAEGTTVIDDLIRGEVTFDNAQLDDLILLRSDGTPTYNLCVVVDDVDMKVSHIIRGDDHLNNTPRQVALYEALGYPIPRFAHLPMILGKDKKKLSKREGAASVTAYREMGLLPEAVVNYLARLGWSHGDKEVFTVPELVEKFSLEAVGKSPAVFDEEKLLWINSQHLKAADPLRIMTLVETELEERGTLEGGVQLTDAWRKAVFASACERSRTLLEMADMVAPFYTERVAIEPDAAKKGFAGDPVPVLKAVAARLKDLEPYDRHTIEEVFQALMAETGLGMGKLAQPVRAAVTGRRVSPGIYEVLELVGRERSLDRIAAAIDQIQSNAAEA
jgi:glutamyl-tRNA synthetase